MASGTVGAAKIHSYGVAHTVSPLHFGGEPGEDAPRLGFRASLLAGERE
jgi:hypothetical protein